MHGKSIPTNPSAVQREETVEEKEERKDKQAGPHNE
jgi:hypothetical protein